MEGKELALLAELSRLHLEKCTGELIITGPGFEKKLYVDGGRLVFAVSNMGQDSLGSILVDAEKITTEQLDDAVAIQAKDPGTMLGTILVWRSYLSPEDLYWGIKFQATRIVYSLFQLEGFDYSFQAKAHERDEILRLNFNTPNIIMEGARRIGSLARMRQEFQPKAFVRIASVAEQERLVELLPRERELMPLLNGRSTVQKLVGLRMMEELELLRFLHGLHSLRLLEQSRNPLTADGSAAAGDGLDAASESAPVESAKTDHDSFVRTEAERARQFGRHHAGRRFYRVAMLLAAVICVSAIAVFAVRGREGRSVDSTSAAAQPPPRQSSEPPPVLPPQEEPTPASATPPEPAPEPVEQAPALSIEGLSVEPLDGQCRISFRLVNTRADAAEQRGYLIVVVSWEHGGHRVVYPLIDAEIDPERDFRRGVPYKISRFKLVDTVFSADTLPLRATVFAFDREGARTFTGDLALRPSR